MTSNASGPALEFMQDIHYLDEGRDATSSNVNQTLGTCLLKYCETLTGCREAITVWKHTLYAYYDDDYVQWFEGNGRQLVNAICANIPRSINSDVGGIGKVYVSYWIQTGLAILGFIGIILWKWLVPNVYFGLLAIRHGWTGASTRSEEVNHMAQKHLSRLSIALTDFQKSQCFFMIATNIAALVVVSRGGLEPQSLQQIYNCWIFLKVIAVDGFLPITFTLTNLYLVGMLSWYIILMSTLTVALSISTFAAVGKFNPSKNEMDKLKEIAASSGPQECSFKQPGVYCYNPISLGRGASNFDSDAYSILGFCLVVLVLMIGHRSKTHELALVRRLPQSFSRRILAPLHGLWSFLQQLSRHQVTILLYARLKPAIRVCWKRILRFSVSSKIPSSLDRLDDWVTAQEDKLQKSKVGQFLMAFWKSACWKHISRFFAPSSDIPSSLVRLDDWITAQDDRLQESRAGQFLMAIWTSICFKMEKRVRMRGWKGFAKSFFKAVLFVVFLSLYLKFFNMFLHNLAWFAKNNVYNNSWNFGQVFAITVWLPPICEFVHLEIRGVQRGFDHRLLPPFRVYRSSDLEHDAAARSSDTLTEVQSDDDLGKCEDMPDESYSSMPADHDDDDDHHRQHQGLQDSPIEGPTAIMPLVEEREEREEREGEQEWLLPEPEFPPNRAITLPWDDI
ncbi:MAG: hypothetical protein Q9181_007795 [Wetmoreana brouardii]